MQLLFQKLHSSERMSSQIVTVIKDRLVNGSLKPGEKLPTEQALIEQFGVSRTPVREAIKTLEAIGVIEIRRGAGMYISNASNNSILNPLIFSLLLHSNNTEKLIEFRQHFEILMVNILVTKPGVNLQHIEKVFQSQIERMSYELSSEELVNIDLEFHYTLLEETENPFVIEIGKTIYEVIRPKMSHFKNPRNIQRTLDTHRYYIEILKGDVPFEPTTEVMQKIKMNEEMIDE